MCVCVCDSRATAERPPRTTHWGENTEARSTPATGKAKEKRISLYISGALLCYCYDIRPHAFPRHQCECVRVSLFGGLFGENLGVFHQLSLSVVKTKSAAGSRMADERGALLVGDGSYVLPYF